MVIEDVGPRGCGGPAGEAVCEEYVGVCGEDYDGAGAVVDEVKHCIKDLRVVRVDVGLEYEVMRVGKWGSGMEGGCEVIGRQ